jgi:hypothetical protein
MTGFVRKTISCPADRRWLGDVFVTLETMFENEVPAGPGAYAAGFGDRLSHGLHIRGHAGGAPGMDADLAIVWETGAAVAVTSNEGDSSTPMLLAEHIADLLAAEGARP